MTKDKKNVEVLDKEDTIELKEQTIGIWLNPENQHYYLVIINYNPAYNDKAKIEKIELTSSKDEAVMEFKKRAVKNRFVI